MANVGPETKVMNLIKLTNISATKTQPHRIVFKHFAIFKNDVHCLEPGETPRPGFKICTTF